MMYSPVVVAGSNIHNYNMSQKKSSKSGKTPSNAHVFRGCRDVLLNPAPRDSPSTSAFTVTSSSGGAGNFAQVLCPFGLTSVTLGASSYTQGAVGNVTGPPLRGLFGRCKDFQWYRVTRAKFVFVGNLGSTVTGTMTMAAYTDPMDISNGTTPALLSSGSTKTFPFSSAAAGKEVSIPVPVDSSWKKVSAILTVPGDMYPFTGTPGALAVVNSVSDLCFGGVQATWIGFSSGGVVANPNLGLFYLDYDLELRAPVDFNVNA